METTLCLKLGVRMEAMIPSPQETVSTGLTEQLPDTGVGIMTGSLRSGQAVIPQDTGVPVSSPPLSG